MQKFLRTLTLVALLVVPWVTQGQNAKVSEYDGSATTAAFSTIVGTTGDVAWTAADQTAGYVDIAMPFAMYFGEDQVTSGSTLRVYDDGSAEFTSITGSQLAPLYYASGYGSTANSIHYKSSAQMLTVEWRKVTANGNSSYSFQLKLYPNGDIEFCYGPMTLGSSINVFTGLQSGTDIFRATGEGTASDWSTLVRATTSGTRTLSSTYYPEQGTVYTFTQPACVKPTGITATATAWNTIHVEWTVSSAGNSYQVKYSTDPDFDPDTEGQSKTATTTNTDVTGLNGSTTYYFYVRKMCGSTPSGWNAVKASATTLQGCFSANMPSVTPDGVVTWTSPDDLVTSYDVKYGLAGFDPENEGTVINNIAGLTTTLPVASMASATAYDIYLRTHCSASNLTTDWVGPISFNTPCGTQNVPFSTVFSSGSLPMCWSTVIVEGTTDWTFSSGDYAYFNYTDGDIGRLITPIINISAAGNYQVDFYHAETYDGDADDSLYVYYRTSATGEWVRLAELGTHQAYGNIAYSHTTLALPNPSATYQLAFEGRGHYGYGVYLGAVTVGLEPTCPTPSGLAATAEGVVTWTAGNNNTSYDIIWDAEGFDLATAGTLIQNITGTTQTLTGMESNHTYDVYLRAHCSATSEVTDWVGPVSFTAPCMPMPITASNPFIEDFESYTYSTSSYTGATELPTCWNVFSDFSLSRIPHIYRSSNNNSFEMTAGTSNCIQNNIAVLPPFTQPLTNLQMSFDCSRESGNADTRIFIGYVTNANDTTTFVPLTEITGVSSSFSHYEYSFAGNTIPAGARIALKVWRSGSYYWARFDNVRVEVIPTCLKPINLAATPNATASSVTATLSWTEVTPTHATQWEVRYWKAGTTDTNSVVVNANPYTLDYLEMAATYNWQVRSLCSATDQSDWSAVSSFSIAECLSGPVPIGNGTSNISYGPVYSSYGNTFYQVIYTAEELQAAGLTAGNISDISFTWSTSTSAKDKDFSIYIGSTDKSTFSSGTDYYDVSTLTLVYGPVTTTNATRADSPVYTFSSPFVWDGTSNIIITTFMNQCDCANNSNTGSSFQAKGSTTSVGDYRALCRYRDSNPYDATNYSTSGYGNRANYRPNIVFNPTAPCNQGECVPPTVAITVGPDGDNAKADLTFSGGEDAYGYVYGPAGFTPNIANGVTVTGNTATITPLAQETTFDLYVYSVCTGVSNPRMVRYSFTTPFVPTCKPQANFATSNVTYTGATVTWQQEDPNQVPEGWTVRYAVNGTIDLEDASTYTEVNVTTASLSLTGLHNGDHIYMYTKATCNAAQNDYSVNWSSYDFAIPTIEAPANVTNWHITNSTDSLSWTEATEGINSWTVRYNAGADFDPDGTEGLTLAATSNKVKLTGLEAYTNYFVYVRANSGDEHSDWSTVATFKTKCPDGGEIALGESTTTNSYLPFYKTYNYSLSEQIYTADELGAANTLSSLSYEVISGNAAREAKIYMGHTSVSSFSSASEAIATEGMTLVFDGIMTAEIGWNTLEFMTNFEYDGTSNLVVVVQRPYHYWNEGTAASFGVISTATSQALYAYSDNYEITPSNVTSGTNSVASVKNNFIFGANCNTDVTCFAPASVNTAITPANVVTVTWAPRTDLEPIVNNFELKYGYEGFNPETQGTLVPNLNNMNSYIINDDFDANTNYDVYVRTVCGENDHSKWTKASFTTYPTCWAPVNLTVSGATTDTSVILSWENDANAPASATATRWEVSYGPEGFDPERGTIVTTTNKTNFAVTGLNHSTKYEFYVRAICNPATSDKSDWSNMATGTTQCGTWSMKDLPLVENFDGVTGTTSSAINSHVLPNCWDYLNTSTTTSGTSTTGYPGYPVAYNASSSSHSGNNHMRFYTYTTAAYGDQYAILPQFGFDLDTVVVGFYARESSTTASYVGTVVVGVMSDPDNASTFVPVDTVMPTTTSYEYFEVNFEGFTGTGSYIALRAPKPTTGYNVVYLDDLTVKLREKVNTLADNGGTIVACNEYIMPDTTNAEYHGGLNATYVVRPADAGYVARIQGDYDLENGYDFLKVYRGTATAANLVGTYTGTGSIDYMTTSELWADSGFVTLVFTTDADNAFAHTGFKFLVSCEQPYANMTPIEDVVEANGTYTWTAGNGETYTRNATSDAAPDRNEDITFWLTNVAGFDSVSRHLTLTVHPTYELTYSHTMCERDTFEFYGQTFTATGNDTVHLTSQYGADSTGILALQVNPAPLAAIYYNNRAVTEIADFCDLADLTLQARSNVTGATFKWDDDSLLATRTVNPHESNTYSVVATNPTTGCTSLPAQVTVTTTPVPALTVSGNNAICYGQSTTLTVADANGLDASYVWKKNGTNVGTGASITVNPTETTTYTVTATTNNASACAVTAEYTVTVNPLPVIATPTTSVSELCLNESVTLNAEVVDGYSYAWSTGATTAEATTVPAATGNYTVTITDANGCVNEFTTATVTVHPSYELNDNQSACIGMLPYTWGAMTLNAAGSYDQTFTIAYGCDSLVHLTFVVEDTAVTNTNRELCQGATFTFGEGIYEQTYTATESTVITYVDTTSGDCPARFNLNLTVNTHNPATVEETVCDTYTWPLNGETYTATGAYETLLKTVKGCDSLVTLNLTVNYQNTGVETVTACDTYTWPLNGETYTATTNEPTFTLQNQWGCDSIVTLDLTVNYRSYHEDFHCVRDAGNYTWLDGVTYNMNVDVSDSLEFITGTNAAGCNEIAILNLVLNPVTDILAWTTVEACDEYEVANAVIFNDENDCEGHIESVFFRESGDHELRTRAADGHDQWTRIHLTVNTSSYHTTMATECLPYTWTILDVNGDPFEIATITADMVNGAAVYNTSVDLAEAGFVSTSCATIEVLRLTPKYPSTEVTDVVTICQNGEWEADNLTVFKGSDYASGIYTWDDSELNTDGCPLSKQVDLTVNPTYKETMELVLCENDFTFDADRNLFVDTIYDEKHEGSFVELTYTDALNGTALHGQTQIADWTTESGCDSVVTITFDVNPATVDTITEVACYEYTWDLTGTIYKVPGTYTEDYVTVNTDGCMHTITLNLTVNDTARSYDTINVCTLFEYKGETYRKTMTFREEAGTTLEGCDSVHYVTYKVVQNALNEQYVYSNKPYTWYDGNTYNTNTEGVFYEVPVAGDCDSVLMLHFTMGEPIVLCENELPYTVTVGNTTVVLDTDAVTGEWTNSDTQGNDTVIAYTIKRNVLETIPMTVCDSYTWTDSIYGDSIYNQSGNYTRTYTAANGCDSVATLSLTVNASTSSNDTVTICDSYTWNGQSYTTSGDYTYDTTNAVGCDSTANLHLTINTNPGVKDTVAACVTYNWKGTDYTTSGTYSVSFTDVNGCVGDSVLNLTINQPVSVEETVVVNADSASYRFNGVLYTAPYDYTVDGDIVVNTVSVVTGCDSTYTLHLVIPFVGIDTIHVNGCGTYTWDKNNITYGWIPMSERQSHGMALFKDLTNNKYVYTYPVDTLFGTDGEMKKISMLVLNMMEAEYTTATLNLPLSLGTWTIDGIDAAHNMTYNFANETVVDTQFFSRDTVMLASVSFCANYCDYTVNLVNNYTVTRDTVCDNVTTYTWHGEQTLGTPGHTFEFEYVENAGTLDETVDSLYVYQLPVNNLAVDTKVACDSIEWNGTWYFASNNTATFQTTTARGCDSTVTLNLTINASTHDAFTAESCDTYTWSNNGSELTYTESGDYVNNYTNAATCASADTLHLTIKKNTNQGYTDTACVSYFWDRSGETYTASCDTTYSYTATSGCPSVDTLHLTINMPTHTAYTETACDSMTWHGTTYYVSGDYNYDYNTEAGCASTDTLHLTINAATHNSETLTQCDSYEWHGTTYTASGDYTYEYTNVATCPSVDTLHLTINVNTTGVEVYDTACDEYTWVLNNNRLYTTSGDYYCTTTDANGCTDTNTLHLTINSTSSYDSTLYISDGSYQYTAQNGNVTFYGPGVYNIAETYTNVAGCDSTLNITLNVGTVLLEVESYTSCSQYTWRNGKTYTWLSSDERAAHQNDDGQPAIYYNSTDNEYVYYMPTYTVPQENNYDSVYMLSLTLTQSTNTTDVVNFPISLEMLHYGDSIFDYSALNSRDFVNTTEYREVHFHSDYYCDSIVDLTVNLVNNYVEAEVADICVTQTSYTWRGHTIDVTPYDDNHNLDYDHAHTYYVYDTVGTAEAPVIEYVKVNQHPVVYATERRTACDSYEWNGTVYTESTTNATYSTVDQYGCDSTVTLMLTIKKSTSSELTDAACETYTWSGITFTESADTTITGLTNAVGCDSTATLHLTVNHKTSTAYTVDACDSYTWENGSGLTYTTADTFFYTYDDAAGICTSVDTLYLTLRKNSNTTYTKTVCDTYTWTAAEGGNDETYTVSGTYTYDYEAENGCPSTNTLNLTVNQNSGHTDVELACDSITWHGTKYIVSGTYTYDYADGNNCPSIDTLELTVNQATHNSVSVIECNSYTWTEGDGNTYTASGIYTHDYTNVAGCASTDTLHLTIGTGHAYGIEHVTVCGPYTWVVNGTEIGTLNESIETSTTVTNPATGCDSTIFLYLTVNPQNITNDTICDNQTYTWAVNSQVYSEAGSYSEKVMDGDICQSEELLVLTVNKTKVTDLTDQICLGNGYTANGFDIAASELAAAGEYTFVLHLTTVDGCDSTVNLTLTVGDVLNNPIEVEACDSYAWNAGDGQTYNYTASGTYNSGAYANAAGCTTVDVLTLTIHNNSSTGYTETVCDGYMWNGTQYTASGDYTYDYTDGNGCASTDTLHLTISASAINTIEMTVCDSYKWENGTEEVYTTSGVYTYSYTTTDGCNGTDYLVLTVNNSTSGNENVTACDSYEWNGVKYNESGVYTFDTTNAVGCDSTATLTLTINNSNTGVDAVVACDSYEWIDGNVYTASNSTATYTLTNAAGCDSVVTLNLTLNTKVTSTYAETACSAYVWDGSYYTESGSYSKTYEAANGCDSVVTLTLTINQPVSNTVSETACGSYTWNGISYTASGVYTLTETAANGCDSVVTLNLTINQPTASTETYESCTDYLWNGQTITATGVYTYTTVNAAGCDSVVTLFFTRLQPVYATVNQTACGSYTWNGQTYTTSGEYNYTTTAVSGCDSIVTLNLTINQPATATVTETACGSYTWNGQTYTTSGNYTYSTTAANGCDSTVTLNLTINNPVTHVISESACESYTWNGQTYTASGAYTYTTTALNGCDSVVTLNLTINQPTTGMETYQSCQNYTWHGQVCDTTGVYTYTTVNAAGCDSVVTLFFTHLQAVQTTVNQTACDSYTWNGQTYTTSGNYTYSTTAANGCDSTVVLVLTINNSTTNNISETACGSYTWNSETYTTSGSYSQTFTGRNGCDSTVVMALTINTPVEVTLTESACSSYEWNGETYTTSGNYTYTTTGINGCDSVTTLHLTVNQPVYVDVEATAQGSYSWNGNVYTESGVYTYTTEGSNGCDSVTTLHLTVIPVYTVTLVSINDEWGTVSESGTMVENGYFTAEATANDGYYFVAWFNGFDTVSTSATYVFQVTEDITLTAVFLPKPVDIEDVDEDNVSIYTSDTRIIVKGAEGQDVHVYDVNGRMMYRELNAPETIEFRMTATGVYLVKVGNAPAKRVVVVR